jgi:hypothetical protein
MDVSDAMGPAVYDDCWGLGRDLGHIMTTLVLGVHDMSYAAQFHTSSGTRKRGVSKAQAAYGKGQTTGDVAQILEAKYHIMRAFVEMNKGEIIKAVESSMLGSVINMVNGQPGPINPAAQAMSDIETNFKQSLSQRAYDGMKGVPTEAANRGVSHRFKKPYGRRGSRPSFIDTGLYQSSFTAWTE